MATALIITASMNIGRGAIRIALIRLGLLATFGSAAG
jgi:hypothetical protein